MKIDKNTAISISVLVALFPAGAWLVDIYSNTKVMATEIKQLQNEREYIRSKLDDISDKIARLTVIIRDQHKKFN